MQCALTYAYLRIKIFCDIVNMFGDILNKKEKIKHKPMSVIQCYSGCCVSYHMASMTVQSEGDMVLVDFRKSRNLLLCVCVLTSTLILVLSLSYSKVTVASRSGPYPVQMVTAVTKSSPYPDQMVDQQLETTSIASHLDSHREKPPGTSGALAI